MARGEINYYHILSLNVAGYRKLRGWTQFQLAERSRISRTYLSMIEAPNIAVNVSLDILISLAEELNVPLSKLFE